MCTQQIACLPGLRPLVVTLPMRKHYKPGLSKVEGMRRSAEKPAFRAKRKSPLHCDVKPMASPELQDIAQASPAMSQCKHQHYCTPSRCPTHAQIRCCLQYFQSSVALHISKQDEGHLQPWVSSMSSYQHLPAMTCRRALKLHVPSDRRLLPIASGAGIRNRRRNFGVGLRGLCVG